MDGPHHYSYWVTNIVVPGKCEFEDFLYSSPFGWGAHYIDGLVTPQPLYITSLLLIMHIHHFNGLHCVVKHGFVM